MLPSDKNMQLTQLVARLSLQAKEFERAARQAAYEMLVFSNEMQWLLYVIHTHRSTLSEALKPW